MSTVVKEQHAGVSATPPTSAPTQEVGHRRVVRIVLGSLGLLAALAFIGAGSFVIWALGTHRDSSGYFTTHTHHYQTSSYALSTETLNLSGITGDLEAGLGKLRIAATSADAAKPLFIGIARTQDVDRYLARVQHDELRDIKFDPFKIDYVRLGGAAPAALPTTEPFWRARASGTGTQTITWPLERGRWSAVVMNADGSRTVSADAQVRARFSYLWWLVTGLFVLGGLSLLGGGRLVYHGVRHGVEPAKAA